MTKTRFFSRIFSLMLILAIMLATRPLRSAQAASVLFVKSTVSGTGNCSSWANACILQTALSDAISGDEIWVAAGTHKPTTDDDRTATFQLKNGVAVYGGFAGAETLRAQRNWSANLTILSGDIGTPDDHTDNSFHVVTGTGTDTSAVLDGFTVTRGYNLGADFGGAGMINGYGSSPTLSNITFSENQALYGAGMLNAGYANPSLTNITFSGNYAWANGGGICNTDHSSPTMTNITFSGNTGYLGGGIWNYLSSNPVMTNVTFNGNIADEGGGIHNERSNPSVTNATFVGNHARNGGGMVNLGVVGTLESIPTLTNVTFTGNTATGNGGGIYNDAGGNPQIRNTILWNNAATGDGAQIYDDIDSDPVVSFSVVQGGYPGGTNIITTDPMLGTPGNNGGFTQTIPLLSGSSAIDTANDTVCSPADQRGITRPQGAHCDIGAFEVVNTPPIVNFSGVTSSLPENTDTSSAIKVADITIIDDGIGINGLSLSGADSTLFEIGVNVLRLKAGSSLDFETNPILNVTVEVNDSTIPGGPEDTEALTINITNINEPPVITSNGGGDTVNLSVAENSSAVTTLTATDVDAGSSLTYSISGGADSTRFTINSSSGALTFVSPPNFESPADVGTNNVYEVTLQVTDGELTDSQALSVTVTDVNETPTDINLSLENVAENRPTNTLVGSLMTSDPDSGDAFTYSLITGTGCTDNSSFGITGNNLVTAAVFDYETKASYSICIRTTDHGGLQYDELFLITVIDLKEMYLPTVMK